MPLRRWVFAAALVGLGAAASPAAGFDVLVRDRDGRPIQFEVEAPGVDVRPYARILRRSVHGPEISRLTVRIKRLSEVQRICDDGESAGCYFSGDRRGLIVVPAGSPDEVRHVLLHEYAHHIDAFRGGTQAAREPNGTWRWWVARGMSKRLRAGTAAQDYSLGWSRSVAEVFAEDYVRLNGLRAYAIPWLQPPSRSILTALHEDITGKEQLPKVAPFARKPAGASPAIGRRIVRKGALRSQSTGAVTFSLRRSERLVSVHAELTAGTRDVDARAALRCEGAPLAAASANDRGRINLQQPDVGPGECNLVLANLGPTAAYSVTITVEPLYFADPTDN
ncbi:MAG: hypothetical protein ACR2N6_04630 [Miltoncostaeaceae bacterium]